MNTQINEIRSSLEIKEDGKVTWMGEPLPFPAKESWEKLNPEEQERYYLQKLERTMYTQYYVFGRPQVYQGQSGVGNGSLDEVFAACHEGTGYWDGGWTLLADEGDRMRVQKDSVNVMVRPDQVRESENGTEVHMPSGRSNLSPGFYVIIGNEGQGSDDGTTTTTTTTRIYFNVRKEGAAELTANLCKYLNDLSVPFFYKVLSDEAGYDRADAAVLYLDKEEYPQAEAFIQEKWTSLEGLLRPETPAFTLAVAPGVGVSEDPGNGLSFGEHRCSILAQVFLRMFFQPKEEVPFEQLLDRAFKAQNIDWQQPYLPSDSDPVYRPLTLPSVYENPTLESMVQRVQETDDPLGVAESVAHFLCDKAVWHRDRCSWVNKSTGIEDKAIARAMDPMIYDGIAGVAWFLADAYRTLRDQQVRKTASGAARCMLDRMEEVFDQRSFSFYQGATGMLLSILIIGERCDDRELRKAAGVWIDRLDERVLDCPETDLLAGLAGTLCGLSQLYERTPEAVHLPRLIRQLADEIAERATWEGERASWKSAGNENEYHLTGISHGASGIAVALMTAGSVLQSDRYNGLIHAALAYEQYWLKQGGGHWPDLRYHSARKSLEHHIESVFWCHGAPGIALTRAVASRYFESPEYHEQAQFNLAKTKESVQDYLATRSEALSMCHGLCGNAAVLQVFGSADANLEGVAALVSQHLQQLERDADQFSALGWFTGIAGMGHSLLSVDGNGSIPLLSPVGSTIRAISTVFQEL